MASMWKSRVLPKIKKFFGSNGKKAAAAEAVKSFDESKEEINKEYQEKKPELQPKVLEIYEASPAEIKTLVKNPTESDLKKNSAAVKKFIEELAKHEFPGSKTVSEAATKFGPSYVEGPITFIFDKVCGLLPAEETAVDAVETASKEVTEEVMAAMKKEAETKVDETTTTTATPPPPAAVAAEETPAPAEPEFPGSKTVSEATTKFGPSYVEGPITFVLEKVSGLLPAEETAVDAVETASKEVTEEVIAELETVKPADATPEQPKA